MNEFLAEQTARNICEAFGFSDKHALYKRLVTTLEQSWKDMLLDSWTVADVLDIAVKYDFQISLHDARAILQKIWEKYDSDLGICNELILEEIVENDINKRRRSPTAEATVL